MRGCDGELKLVETQRLTVAFGNDELNGLSAVSDFISIHPDH